MELLAVAGIFAATAAVLVYHVRRNGQQIKALEARFDGQHDDARKALAASNEIATAAKQGREQASLALSQVRSLEAKVAKLNSSANEDDPLPELAKQIGELSDAVTQAAVEATERHNALHTRLVVAEDEAEKLSTRLDNLTISKGRMPEGHGL